MSMTMTAAPAAEPVTLAAAKAHLRVDSDAEDAFISSLIITSRLQIEAALGLALVTQSWRLELDDWPANGTIELPMRPVQTVGAITISSAYETAVTIAPDTYIVDGQGVPPRILLTSLPMVPHAPAGGISIAFTAGFGNAAAVPQDIKQALLLIVAHWYENREPNADGRSVAIPEAVSALLSSHRVVRL